MRKLLVYILLTPVLYGSAQRNVRIAFYNVENLFDTIPSEFYNDRDFTPSGGYGWNTIRYNNKITNLARVIDDLSPDIIGLAEVENETVVRDLVNALGDDYNYVHRNTRDSRGLDVALLYKGDKFVPEVESQIKSGTTRDFLYVKGELYGTRLDVIVCHMPSKLNGNLYRANAFARLKYFADSLNTADRGSRTVIIGDFNASPSDKLLKRYFYSGSDAILEGQTMFSPLENFTGMISGSYVYNNKWSLIDNVYLSTAFFGDEKMRYMACGIFIKPYLLRNDPRAKQGAPLRTFIGGRYMNGYSDHLPVYVIISVDN